MIRIRRSLSSEFLPIEVSSRAFLYKASDFLQGFDESVLPPQASS
ncbi:MAG: hypothetical protein ACKO0M_16840 [Cyanobium sp.]